LKKTLPNDPGISFYDRRALVFYLCASLYFGAIYVSMPILAPYAQFVGGSLQSAGLVISAYGLPQLLLRIPLGLWSDGLRRRKPFILFAFLLEGIGGCGLIGSNSVVLLFFSVLTLGIAACAWVPFTVLFASYFPAAQIGQSMGFLLFSTRVSQGITNYFGGVIAEAGGWTAPFYAGLILTAMGFLLALGIPENRPEERPGSSWGRFLAVSKSPMVLMVSALAFLVQFANFSTTYGFTPIYAQRLGASKGDLGTLLFVFMVPNVLATFLAAPIARRFKERRVACAGFLAIAAAVFCTPWSDSLAILFALQALNGTGVGVIFPPLMGLAIKSMPHDQQATAMGNFQSIYAIGMTLGPLLSGWVGDHWGLSWIFILSGILCSLGGFIAWKNIAAD
jgi:predicted MFS family arabinose efflux permease